MGARFIMHPLLLSKKGRWLVLILILVVAASEFLVIHKINSILTQLGLRPRYLSTYNLPMLFLQLISLPAQVFMVLMSAVIGGSYINRKVMGPLKRIEQWLI